MLGKELTHCLQSILAASRRSHNQVHKTTSAMLKGYPTGDQLGELLEYISQTKNKKLYELGLQLIELEKFNVKIDFYYIFSFLDSPSQKDPDIILRYVKQLQKMLNTYFVSAVMFQKMYNYFMVVYANEDSRLKERAKYSLYSLFQMFFSQERYEYRGVVLQLLNDLSYDKTNSYLLFYLMVKVDGVVARYYSDNFIETALKRNNTDKVVFVMRDDPVIIAIFFEMVYRFAEAANINLVLYAIIKYLHLIRYHNSQITIIVFIKDLWLKYIVTLEKIYRSSPKNILLFGKILRFVEETLSRTCYNGGKDPFSAYYEAAVQPMLLVLGYSLNNYMDIRTKLYARKFLRPLDEHLIETKKSVFYRCLLDEIAYPVSRMLATMAKWSNFLHFKQLIKQLEYWIDRCGLYRSDKALCHFLKSVAYLCLPKKGTNVITDKNLRSIKLLLDILYQKIFLLDVTSLTLVLKVFQALYEFFCIYGTLSTTEELINKTYVEEEVLNDFNLVKYGIKRLFYNSNELSSKLLSIFFDSLTQVALDSFEKAQYSRYKFKYLTFSLYKTGRIALNNISRIVDFKQPFLNFMLIHLHSSDMKIGEAAAYIFCKIQLKIAYYLFLNRKPINYVYKSLYDAACSSPYIELLNWIMDCVTKMVNYFGELYQYTLIICSIIRKIWPKANQKTLMYAEQCISCCIKYLKYSNLTEAKELTSLVKEITSTKRQQLQYQDWKITGNLLLQLIKIISTETYQEFGSDMEERKSLARIRHNLSCREKSLENLQDWLNLTKDTMQLIFLLFLDSEFVHRKRYIEIFCLKFFSNSHGFRYYLIYDVMLPIFCKMLLKIVDYSLVGAAVVETPNFRVGTIPINQEAYDWKTLLYKFINTVWNKIAYIISFVDTNGSTQVGTLMMCLSHSMTKKCISVSLILMDNLMHLMEYLPSTTHKQLVMHLPALFHQFRQLVYIIQSVGEHVQFVENLHKFSEKIILLMDGFPAGIQISIIEFCLMLQVNRHYYNLKYDYDYTAILQSVKLYALLELEKMDKIPSNIKVEIEKQKKQHNFKLQLHKCLKNSERLPDYPYISSVFSILFTMKPEMPGGLVKFLRDTVLMKLETPYQYLDMLLIGVRTLLSMKAVDHYSYHMSLITDAIINNSLRLRYLSDYGRILKELVKMYYHKDLSYLFLKVFYKALDEKQYLEQVLKAATYFHPVHRPYAHISHNYHKTLQILTENADKPELVRQIATVLKQIKFY